MGVIALRYPVSKEGTIKMDGIGGPHMCFVEQPGEEVIQTPRIIHPEMAASLAGSSAPSCNRYFSQNFKSYPIESLLVKFPVTYSGDL